MMKRNTYYLVFNNIIRKYTTKVKTKVTADEKVVNNIENNAFKPRHHPGIFKPRTVLIPDTFYKTIQSVLADYPVKILVQNSQNLVLHLRGKVPPMERDEIRSTEQKVRESVLKRYSNVVLETEADQLKHQKICQAKIEKILNAKIYNWKPIKYDTTKSLLYLIGRSAAEYAVLVKIFSEINSRDPDFKPKSMFDFGSGVGTVMWAVNLYWQKYLYEYFNVDCSSHMNDLSETLLQGGKGTGNNPLKGVFYRQFLPSSNTSYDLVVSAYSLMELPSLETRLETVLNLWNKTQQYLVIVEQGTNAGFKVVNQVRDFILQIDKTNSVGHVFSPCPHDEVCPRFVLDDGTPCNFEVSYFSMPFTGTSELQQERYCYVVLKKGARADSHNLKWPRIIRPTLVRSKHCICRFCSAHGKLEEVVFTASKHGRVTYRCAKASAWGDLLPLTTEQVNITEREQEEEKENTEDCR